MVLETYSVDAHNGTIKCYIPGAVHDFVYAFNSRILFHTPEDLSEPIVQWVFNWS